MAPRTPTARLPRRPRSRERGASLRALLGGGASLPALQLTVLWIAALHGAPLAHALEHRTERSGHCHGAICHDLDAGAPSPEVRDGALPERGGLDLAHGDLLALDLAPFAFVRAVLGLRAPEAPRPWASPRARMLVAPWWARGPPRA